MDRVILIRGDLQDRDPQAFRSSFTRGWTGLPLDSSEVRALLSVKPLRIDHFSTAQPRPQGGSPLLQLESDFG